MPPSSKNSVLYDLVVVGSSAGGIEALVLLDDLQQAPKYVVAGQTHPKVIEREGETYRSNLGRLVRERALSGSVSLDGRYRDAQELGQLIETADVLVTAASLDEVG